MWDDTATYCRLRFCDPRLDEMYDHHGVARAVKEDTHTWCLKCGDRPCVEDTQYFVTEYEIDRTTLNQDADVVSTYITSDDKTSS